MYIHERHIPLESNIFCGLTSKWTIYFECINSSAWANCLVKFFDSSSVKVFRSPTQYSTISPPIALKIILECQKKHRLIFTGVILIWQKMNISDGWSFRFIFHIFVSVKTINLRVNWFLVLLWLTWNRENFQILIFTFLGCLMLYAEKLNELLAQQKWISRQNYFDSSGMFFTIVIGAPGMII